LILYSDGVLEARDARGAFFGSEGMLAVLHAASRSAAGDVEAVLAAAGNFQHGPRNDDRTVLVAHWSRP